MKPWPLAPLALAACMIGASNEDPTQFVGAVTADAAALAPLDASAAVLDASRPTDARPPDASRALDAAAGRDATAPPQTCMPVTPAMTCDPVNCVQRRRA